MHPQEIFTTEEGIKATIETDRFSFRWFSHLVNQPKILEIILADERLKVILRNFNRCMFVQWLLGWLIVSSPMLWVFSKIIFISLIFILSIIFIKFRSMAKKFLAQIGLGLIKKEYRDESFEHETFFTICERLAEKAQTFSLVDAIYHLDKIRRFALVFSFVLICYIVGIENWWQRYLCITFVYVFFYIVSQLNIFYKRFD